MIPLAIIAVVFIFTDHQSLAFVAAVSAANITHPIGATSDRGTGG